MQAETGRICSVALLRALRGPRATAKAAELVQAGAIGRVVQTVGLGPHRLDRHLRPAWFFERERYGGILCDIASHQVDQFLFFTGSTDAEVVAAAVGNFANPDDPGLEDFGEMHAPRRRSASGYVRVDWYTPDGLPTWGDGRLTILGTEGYIELRKYVDIAGRPGTDHLFLVDGEGTRYVDCSDVDLPYPGTWSPTSSSAPRPPCPRPTPSRPPSWLSWPRPRRRAWATCVEPPPSGFRRGRQNWHRARRGLPARPRRPVAGGSPSRAVGAHRRAARAGRARR